MLVASGCSFLSQLGNGKHCTIKEELTNFEPVSLGDRTMCTSLEQVVRMFSVLVANVPDERLPLGQYHVPKASHGWSSTPMEMILHRFLPFCDELASTLFSNLEKLLCNRFSDMPDIEEVFCAWLLFSYPLCYGTVPIGNEDRNRQAGLLEVCKGILCPLQFHFCAALNLVGLKCETGLISFFIGLSKLMGTETVCLPVNSLMHCDMFVF